MTSIYNEKITKVKTALENEFEKKSNKITSWSNTTTNTNYPSEKLVKDSLDLKANSSHAHSSIQGVLGLYLVNEDVSNDLLYALDDSLIYDINSTKIYYLDKTNANNEIATKQDIVDAIGNAISYINQ